MRGTRAAALLIGLLAALPASAHDQQFPESDPPVDPPAIPAAECHHGLAGDFPCHNVDLLAWLPLAEFAAGRANDVWGWTDPRSGREYALLGLEGGVAFVDLADPGDPLFLGILPTATVSSSWRDVKVYADYAFVVSEAPAHGMQVFDLKELADVTDPPVVFAPSARYTEFGNAHNIAIDEETGFAYAVGTRGSCGSGLHIIDIATPTAPVFAGCFSADGYTHDAQCVVYAGPDALHTGEEICFNSNEDTLTIVDVTAKALPTMLSRTGYPNHGYTHQGWLTEDQRYFLVDDELDELHFVHPTRTYVWNVSDLEAPVLVGFHDGSVPSTDHNLYVRGDNVYQANYRSGLRVLRIVDLARADLMEAAYFDTVPSSDAAGFSGAWSVYPFFESGVVIVSDINQGLFVLWPELRAAGACAEGPDADGDGVRDACDNCVARANADQRDADFDGYGNRCDADLDEDGYVGSADLAEFRRAWNACAGEPAYAVQADLDGDGCVWLPDLATFRTLFASRPGPSGLSCAGEADCESP